MPSWDEIFKRKGTVFKKPHPNVKKIGKMFLKKGFQKILDLGCGTGRHLVMFSKMGFEVFGFDVSEFAIQLANKWLNKENLKANLLISSMIERFPYDDNFFDAIVSTNVIHHNRKKEILYTISEIIRVLKSGGLLFITVPILDSEPELMEDNMEKVEDGTFIPLSGLDKDIPHHFFNKEEIYNVFKAFEILSLKIDKTKHWAILGKKK